MSGAVPTQRARVTPPLERTASHEQRRRPPRRARDAGRVAPVGTDADSGTCRVARRASEAAWPPRRALHVCVCVRGAPRRPDRARDREYAPGEAELGCRHGPRLARLDHPRQRRSRLAPGNPHERRLPSANPTQTATYRPVWSLPWLTARRRRPTAPGDAWGRTVERAGSIVDAQGPDDLPGQPRSRQQRDPLQSGCGCRAARKRQLLLARPRPAGRGRLRDPTRGLRVPPARGRGLRALRPAGEDRGLRRLRLPRRLRRLTRR